MKLATKTLTLKRDRHRVKYIDRVWELLISGYQDVKGGLLFETKEDLLSTTAQWKVIMYGKRVIGVTVYKVKRGLKLVAMCVTKIDTYRKMALQVLEKVIRNDLKKCWMELSEGAERFVMKFAKAYVIPNHLVPSILGKKIELSDDGVHYARVIQNIKKEKILLGTPVL